jgi:UDP-N-acetylmuramate--alanine ligase
LLDALILMEIYPARELPIPGVNASMLLEGVKIKNKTICQKEDLLKEVSNRDLEVLLTLGAGDIDQFVEPLRIMLNNKLC